MRFKLLLILAFTLLSSQIFAGNLTYEFTDNAVTFKLNFDRGYSNVLDFDDGQHKIVTFESTETVLFERQDFFDIPVKSAWLESEGTRKKLVFKFDSGKLIEPVITKQNKLVLIKFDFPIVEEVKAPSAIPGIGAYFRMFFGLILIIAIIIASYAVMRYLLRNNVVTDIPGVGRLLGKVNLDIKKQLAFYELGDCIYIIGVTENNINIIDKITDQAEINVIKSGFSKRREFSSYLKLFRKPTELSSDFEAAAGDIKERVSSVKRK